MIKYSGCKEANLQRRRRKEEDEVDEEVAEIARTQF